MGVVSIILSLKNYAKVVIGLFVVPREYSLRLAAYDSGCASVEVLKGIRPSTYVNVQDVTNYRNIAK